MSTRRLYWEEPCGRSFSGRVVRCSLKDGKLAVFLDRTLFHPEGGGQPCDAGRLTFSDDGLASKLGGSVLAVSGVVEEDGEIAHLVDLGRPASDVLSSLAGPPTGGWAVHGDIDWGRRFDLMQQHTGQHILSRAFEEVLGASTVGFRLAEDYVSIDLDAQSLNPREVPPVEDLANRMVFENLPVIAEEHRREDLPGDLRSRFEIRSERVRVVYVGGFDACPCGGTHVTSSSQVGLIKITATDRAHGGVRVIFRCGRRALLDYREKQEILEETARLLSQPPRAVPAAVNALGDRLRDLQDGLEECQKAVLDLEIEGILRAAAADASESVVASLAGRTPEELKYAAKRMTAESGKLSVCFSSEPRFSMVVSSPPSGPDARSVVASVVARWGGRGGGMRDLAQLGSREPLAAGAPEVETDLKRLCKEIARGGSNPSGTSR